MPYAIRKIGSSEKPFCVVNTETDDNKGCSKTEAEAKKHLAVLNMREHGVPEKKESAMAEIEPTKVELTLPAEYVERLKTFEQAAVAFLGDKAPVPPPLPTAAEPMSEPAESQPIEPSAAKSIAEATEVTEQVEGEVTLGEHVATDLQVEQYVGGIVSTPEQKSQPDISPVNELQLIDKEEAKEQVAEGLLPELSLPDLVPEPLLPQPPPPIPELTRIEISKLDQIKLWVKSIFEKVCGAEPVEPEENPYLPLFITKEQSDGTFRWISISNTAFLDREKEIVSTEGVAGSIARADLVGYHGDLRFWHERSIVLGTCDLQAQDGVCLVESGLWHNTPLAKSVREGLAKSPIAWGKSIGFYPLTAPQEDVVIKGATVRRLWTDLQIVERSILPNSEAASLFTQITTRGLSMEQKKKDALVELLGDEALVDEVLAKAAEINKAASDPTAIVKEADTTPSATEEIKESQPEGEKATQTETVDTEVKEAEDTTPTPDAKGNDDEILIAVKTLGTQVKALQLQVKALQEAQSAPRMAIHRPTFTSDTADDTDTEVLKATSNGEAPRAVQAIGRQVLGIGG